MTAVALAGARQQQRRGAKINNDWQALRYSPLGRGRINGHTRNRENRRHQHPENRSAHLATIGALVRCKSHSAAEVVDSPVSTDM